MRDILIDVTRLVGRVLIRARLATGIDRVGLAYVAHYRHRARAVVRIRSRLLVLGVQTSSELFGKLLDPKPAYKMSLAVQLAKAWWTSPGNLKQVVLLNTGHSGLEVPAYSTSLQRLGVSPVFLLHDLIPISHPEYCRAGELDRHRRRIDTALKVGRGLILNSRETLKELQDYADQKNWPLPPAIAAHLAPPTLPAPGGNPVGKPYFVMLGTIEPRKNHWMLLQVWRSLIEQYGSHAPQLIIVGQRGWECENVADLLERGAHLREHVVELPRCTDAQLSTYLHHAQALLFPSFAEGYGLPLVEALSVGTPVIASNLQVFHEIAGDIPEYLDPLDGPGWRSLIDAYSVADSSMREAQKLRMQHYVPPSWSRHFEQVDAFLEKLA